MDQNKTALERAFELARSGRFPTAGDISRAISQEGYSAAQIEGFALRRQLTALIKQARAASAESKPS
jgi:hypothetical protein